MRKIALLPILLAAMLLTMQLPTSRLACSAEANTGAVLKVVQGKASYYGKNHHGKRTASGERFDENALVAAHPSWPFQTLVRVTNLASGKKTTVRIVDRGPTKKMQRRGVIIDLSTKAAKVLGFIKQGKTSVRLDVLRWGK